MPKVIKSRKVEPAPPITIKTAPPSASEVYRIVRLIPEGKVCSYGDIAKILNSPQHSRHIGAMLKILPKKFSLPTLPQERLPQNEEEDEDEILPEPLPNPDFVPWHRVVNSSGIISPRGNLNAVLRQADWLVAEGIEVRNGARNGGGGGEEGDVPQGVDAFGLGGVEGGRVNMSIYRWRGP